MKAVHCEVLLICLLFWASLISEINAASKQQAFLCAQWTKCRSKLIKCPKECPKVKPDDPTARKGCFVDCNSPKCEAHCRNRKPNCNAPGAACFDPRFIGGDGIVFYFHGRKDEHFSLISDPKFQINARFIGLRPSGRTRDYTWIQALGIMSGPHKFTLEAKRTGKWDDGADHLYFTYNGEPLTVPESHLSEWRSQDDNLVLERTSNRNSVTVTLVGIAEVSVNVVPVTEEEDRIHNYNIPSDDCFAHLEVQFKFWSLSPVVEGVIGRTYRLDFENPVKRGVAMPVLGGEDEYGTSSLLAKDCPSCLFSPSESTAAVEGTPAMPFEPVNCSSRLGSGLGLVCKKIICSQTATDYVSVKKQGNPTG
ncbi:hypothetical protein H6P81_005639 [Aristolochia fimbriata]|uniref:Uncharacterized protein n=1 Tax=Aristolochia fimbriata TaxID=158543 RepID=A0AAV7EV09_ARIFI|nr:hypothetical protein H6P81_005639 [Aristolochia fimbriata]